MPGFWRPMPSRTPAGHVGRSRGGVARASPERRAAGDDGAEPRQVDGIGRLDAIAERARRDDDGRDEHEAAADVDLHRHGPAAEGVDGGRRRWGRCGIDRGDGRDPGDRLRRQRADRRLDPAHRRRPTRLRRERAAPRLHAGCPQSSSSAANAGPSRHARDGPAGPGDDAPQARAGGAPDRGLDEDLQPGLAPRLRRPRRRRPPAAPLPAQRRDAHPPAATDRQPREGPEERGRSGGEGLIGPAFVVQHEIEDRPPMAQAAVGRRDDVLDLVGQQARRVDLAPRTGRRTTASRTGRRARPRRPAAARRGSRPPQRSGAGAASGRRPRTAAPAARSCPPCPPVAAS